MRLKYIIISLLVCCALESSAQPTQQTHEWEWYLDEVVNDVFVGRNYFEYYYTPSAADMKQQREQGEVNYFLNSPDGLNSKKVRDMIDRLMASYDDIKAVSGWNATTSTYWKEFRYEKNKFRFSVKRKALEDGTYYVSVTETAGYFKSLGKKEAQDPESATRATADHPTARHSKRDRKPVVIADNEVDKSMQDIAVDQEDEPLQAPALSTKEQRKLDKERREAERRELRAKQRREQEQRREQARAQKEGEKLKKAEEKKQRQEQERIKKEEKRREQEQRRELERKEREERAARQQAATAAKKQSSRYHYTDVALWLSEKYDFTQTSMSDNGCTMYSIAVKDVEMAKLAIKNALKGSNARMAVPWRLNSGTHAIETGYTVDDHILVFAIGKDDKNQITLEITEVSQDEFELFKQHK